MVVGDHEPNDHHHQKHGRHEQVQIAAKSAKRGLDRIGNRRDRIAHNREREGDQQHCVRLHDPPDAARRTGFQGCGHDEQRRPGFPAHQRDLTSPETSDRGEPIRRATIALMIGVSRRGQPDDVSAQTRWCRNTVLTWCKPTRGVEPRTPSLRVMLSQPITHRERAATHSGAQLHLRHPSIAFSSSVTVTASTNSRSRPGWS